MGQRSGGVVAGSRDRGGGMGTSEDSGARRIEKFDERLREVEGFMSAIEADHVRVMSAIFGNHQPGLIQVVTEFVTEYRTQQKEEKEQSEKDKEAYKKQHDIEKESREKTNNRITWLLAALTIFVALLGVAVAYKQIRSGVEAVPKLFQHSSNDPINAHNSAPKYLSDGLGDRYDHTFDRNGNVVPERTAK